MLKVTFLLKFGLFLAIMSTICNNILIASHVVGGNLEMVTIDKVPGRYKIALNMYFDEINQNVGGAPAANALLYVYRKSDNKQVTSFYINGSARQAIKYTNQACATSRQIKTSLYRYEGIVNWNPADYTDAAGYYMTWQYCCRNGDIDNIRNPSQAGQTFYLEFPALSQNGNPIFNSSPVFDQVDGEYLCVNDPFRFSFDAKDADGDELRYLLETPFDRLDPTLGVGSTNGLTVQWLSNFNAYSAIPGTPPLSINKQTGELTVMPNQLGLFIFTVVVEEYRNGTKIGLVRRDYQLFVVDCPPTAPPDPTITLNNLSATQIQLCEGKTAELKAASNANWEYQWKKDGNNIPGAIAPTFVAAESGTYQLITSLKAQCSKSRRSSDIKVTVTKLRFKIKSQDSLRICGTSGIVRLDAFSGGGLTYQWYLDGKALPETSMTLIARQPGRYWAIVRDYIQGCTSFSDTLQIKSIPLPIVSITPQLATTAICAGDSMLLTTPSQLNYHYQWLINETTLSGAVTNSLIVRQAGQYQVNVVDGDGCQAQSQPYTISITPTIHVSLDTLPIFCGTNHSPVKLQGLPSGGFFTGTGIVGNQFDPSVAGKGLHTIHYTVKSSFACQSGDAFTTVRVLSLPDISLGADLEIWRGNTILLNNSVNKAYSYQWTPTTGLSDPSASNSQASPEQTTSYTLIAKDSYGCIAIDSITVNVYDRIWIPDAFSPNGDGYNDSWELRGIESYPQAEVTIFNRWGEIVFFSKQYKSPFNGQHQNLLLPTGVYPYQIKPSPTQGILQGSLTLLR